MISFSNEAMQAVLQSKLGRELDALFQDVIDYRDNSLKEMSFKGRLLALEKFFSSTTAKKIITCIWRNVGLQINRIVLTNIGGPSFCSAVFMDKDGRDNQTGTFQISDILSGGYMSRWLKDQIGGDPEEHFSADQLMMIASSYDSTKGIITEAKRLELRRFVKFDLGFDIGLGFLLEDMLASNAGVGNLTAQEITAVILHEIGHVICLIEHAADCYARMESFKYIFTAFERVNADNAETVFRLADLVYEKLNDVGDRENAARLSELTKKLKKDINTAGSGAVDNTVRKAFVGFIEGMYSFTTDLFVVPFNMLVGTQANLRFNKQDQKNKYGDIPINSRMVTWEERKADEYVLSNGYAAAMATNQLKLNKFADRFGLSKEAVATLNTAERLRQDLGFFTKMKLSLMAPNLVRGGGYMLYPEGAKRFREMLNVTIQQLKAHASDAEYVIRYMKDCETIMKCIEENSTTDEFVAKTYRGYDLFIKYCSLPSFFDWIVNGRVRRELEDLVNDVNKIGNNLLTYYGFKLQQLSSK